MPTLHTAYTRLIIKWLGDIDHNSEAILQMESAAGRESYSQSIRTTTDAIRNLLLEIALVDVEIEQIVAPAGDEDRQGALV